LSAFAGLQGGHGLVYFTGSREFAFRGGVEISSLRFIQHAYVTGMDVNVNTK